MSGRLVAWTDVLTAQGARWRWSSLLAVAALLTGIAYCVVTFAYWRATREVIDQLRGQTVLAQRPWITMSRIRLLEPLAAGRPVSAAVSVKNTGQSPALEVLMSGMLVVRRTAPGFVDYRWRSAAHGSGASDEQVIRVEFDGGALRDDDFAELRSGRQVLYAIAEVNYTDVLAIPRQPMCAGGRAC
jgi:hypothetical protein